MRVCPRCQFEQPVDKFCAKCGVDMDLYVPDAFSFFRRKSNLIPVVGIVLALGLMGVSLWFMTHSRDSLTTIENTVAQLDGQAQSPNQGPGTQPSNSAPAQVQGRQNERTAPAAAGAMYRPQPVAAPLEAAQGAADDLAAKATSEKTEKSEKPSSIRTDFALIFRDHINRFDQDAEGHITSGRYSMATIPQFKMRLATLQKESVLKILDGESHPLALNQSSLVFRGGLKGNDTVGLFVDITPTKQSERGTEYHVNLKKSLPEINATGEMKINSQSNDEIFFVPPGYGVAISGFIPHRPTSDYEEDYYKSNILRVMLDPSYQKGETEFLILIHTDGSDAATGADSK